MKLSFKKLLDKPKAFLVKHKEKVEKLKAFVLTVLGYGVLLNYALFVVWRVPFTWYGFPAFGILYYFVMEEFVTFFRKLRAKIYQ